MAEVPIGAAIEAAKFVAAQLATGAARQAGKDIWNRIKGVTKLEGDEPPANLEEVLLEQAKTNRELVALLQEIHGQGEADRARLRPPRNLRQRNEKFVGRVTELNDLHGLLNDHHLVGVTQQAVAHGHGGVGKTTVAVEYAWRHLDDYPGGVFILRCETTDLLPQILQVADCVGIPEADKPETTAQHVKEHLEAGEPALLILDNVRDAQQWTDKEWSAYIPAGNCRRLITTRCPRLPGEEMYTIGRLSREHGIELLDMYRDDADHDGNIAIAGDIVDFFDGLAVGLTVVGIYMSMHAELTWERYAQSLDRKGLGAVRATEDDAGTPPDYDKRVDAVFDETVDALPPAQRRALEYAALLPPDMVLRVWLGWLLERDETIELPSLPGYEDAPATPVIDELVRSRLLRPTEQQEDWLSLHRVLRMRLHERLDEGKETQDSLLDQLCELGDVRGVVSHGALTDKSLRPELDALLALSDELLVRERTVAAATIADGVHVPLRQLAYWRRDRASLERFFDASGTCRFEASDPVEAASLLASLALTMMDLGDLATARAYIVRATGIRETHCAPNDPMLAITYTNFAWILMVADDRAPVREYMQRAIGILEKHFEPDHPMLAAPYSNLGTILKYLGELAAARQYMQRAVEIDEKNRGPDHPTLAVRFNNLAHIELTEGNTHRACELWRKAYAIVSKHFDEDHPHLKATIEMLERHCGGVPGD